MALFDEQDVVDEIKQARLKVIRHFCFLLNQTMTHQMQSNDFSWIFLES